MLKKCALFILLLLTISHISWQMNSWTYEVTDVKTNSKNPDLLKLVMKVERIRRGVYGVAGFMDINFDADDNVIVETMLFHSRNGGNVDEYKKLPMQIANETLTFTMNKFYKPYIMESLVKCSEDAPEFDEFVVPLTKRNITMKNCIVSTDNLPSHMSEGYYRFLFKVYGPVEAYADFYFKVELALF